MQSIRIFLSILLQLIAITFVTSYMVEDETTAMMYLERFGYIDMEDMQDEMGMEEKKPMLMAFQKMCNIKQTGELDKKTMEMMNAPRCGNKDMMHVLVNETNDFSSTNRVKRYMLNEHNLKWKTREVTYKMGMFSDEMQKHVTKAQVFESIQTAFRLWSGVTNLDFIHTPTKPQVDIELSFTSRFHIQDEYPFDGPGKVLAHAFPPGPGIGGDVHFEDEEEWHVHSPKGTDVLFVALHEIGHALGLSHSSTKGSIMAAFYGGYRPQLTLHPDDIQGIQALYGKRETSVTKRPVVAPKPSTTLRTTVRPTTRATQKTTLTYPTTKVISFETTIRTTPRTSNRLIPSKGPKDDNRRTRPDLCIDSKIDAITTLKDGEIYVFKDSYVFQIDSKGQGVNPGWPNHIGSVFQGLETNIDAAATRENGKTYFFKGKKYWRFTGFTMDQNYPKDILKHFPGIPAYVESAFVWDGQFYFTKGDKFWRFNPKGKPNVDNRYPLPISIWGLFTHGIDAAFMAPHKEIYFFKDNQYFRFNQWTFKIANVEPPYPRSSILMWFGCTTYRPIDSRNIRMYGIPNLLHKSGDDYDNYEDY